MRLLLLSLMIICSGCATRATMTTYGPDESKNITKRVVIEQTGWKGLPALAPMTSSFKDGDIESSATSIELPDLDLDSIISSD